MDLPAGTSLWCGHCFCCESACASSSVDTYPMCEAPVQGKTKLYGSVQTLSDLLASPQRPAVVIQGCQEAATQCALTAEQQKQMAILEEQLAALKSKLWAEKELTKEHATQCVLMTDQQKTMAILEDQLASSKLELSAEKELTKQNATQFELMVEQ
mmetsp:Transcript_87720/g.142034  ORF Transcript_87720/g.142034 Transcript_87720/m.142034 type:complete len:156 (+) Transcript_87720:77-544(+)